MVMMKMENCKKINCTHNCDMVINGIPVSDWCKECVCLDLLPRMGCCRTYVNHCPNQYRKCKHRFDIDKEMQQFGYGEMK